jgi:integrase
MDENSRFPFTKIRLAGLPVPKAGRAVYHDTHTPGLILRITDKGQRSFYFYRKVKGRPMRLLLGIFPEMSVEQARKACQATAGAVSQGRDPQAERRAARHEQTVGGLFTYWLDTHAKQYKRSWKEDERQYNVFIKPLAHRKLSSIKKADVQTLHARVGERHGRYAANRLLALLRAMFNKAPDMGFTGGNPTACVKKFSEEKRDRFLHGDELPDFFRSLLAEPNALLRDFFLIALLTGARRANVQTMAWEDINFDAGVWRIPTTKSGEPVVVPLSDAAAAILQARRKAGNGSPWVFPSRGKTGHLVEPKTAWKRICDRAGLSDVRVHDLRRSLGSWQAMTGASLPIIGKSLGHTQPATTAIYARLQVDPVRVSVEAATAAMLQAGGVKLLTAEAENGGDNGQTE